MAVVLNTLYTSPLPGGFRLVWGTANVGTYAAKGASFNLANYLTNTYAVTVVPAASNGYVLCHNGGTAYTGGIACYHTLLNTDTVNGVAANLALFECQTGLALATVCFRFYAIGSAL